MIRISKYARKEEEFLQVYDLAGKLLGIEERKKFYKDARAEFAKKGKISQKVKTIRLLLLDSNGRIFLQKRSKIKKDNTGLYDKTVGGHVHADDSFEMTAIRECIEELGFPTTILTEETYDKALKTTDLDIIGVFRKVDFVETFLSVRKRKNAKDFIQPLISTMYIGYYNGPIKFKDGESSGIETFSLKELEKDIKENPEKFTEDIKFMLKKYRKYLKPIK
jgi:isopentenyldiphosphate isomerase